LGEAGLGEAEWISFLETQNFAKAVLDASANRWVRLYQQIAILFDAPPFISRWRDYSTVSVDPSDPTRFWSIQMFPSDAASNDVWSTQITELLTSQVLPHLTIAKTGTNVMVSWLGIAAGFQLQSATSLTPPIAWSNVTNTASTNGGTISVLVPVSGNQTFFRLQR